MKTSTYVIELHESDNGYWLLALINKSEMESVTLAIEPSRELLHDRAVRLARVLDNATLDERAFEELREEKIVLYERGIAATERLIADPAMSEEWRLRETRHLESSRQRLAGLRAWVRRPTTT